MDRTTIITTLLTGCARPGMDAAEADRLVASAELIADRIAHPAPATVTVLRPPAAPQGIFQMLLKTLLPRAIDDRGLDGLSRDLGALDVAVAPQTLKRLARGTTNIGRSPGTRYPAASLPRQKRILDGLRALGYQ